MQRSNGRILTTHAGSLPRPPSLVALLAAKSRGEPVDEAALASEIESATRLAVERQAACGVDIANDGEQARESFATYVQHRMSGFGGQWRRGMMRDLLEYPTFRDAMRRSGLGGGVSLGLVPQCTGPVAYTDAGRAAFRAECDAFERAISATGAAFRAKFMTAVSPGIVATIMRDTHYGDLDAYVAAIGAALREEYRAIAERGYLLQVDAPDLAMERHTLFADRPLGDFLHFVDTVVDAINGATEGIDPANWRLHVCWGNYEGPHTFDVPLADILPHLYRARTGALVLSLANPRHAHELRVLRELPLPPDWSLVVGCIDTTTNYVEHPEVVAERLERAADVVGDPSRIIAGTDCGFDTAAGFGMVAEEMVWLKLQALRDGAALASQRLF